MHIAPLLVLMNADTPEEFRAIGQVLLFSFMPSLSKAQSRTVTALSAQQSISDLSRQQKRRYNQGRQDVEDELIDELKSLLLHPDMQEDPPGILGRVRKRLLPFVEDNAATLKDKYKDNAKMASLSGLVKMMTPRPPTSKAAETTSQQELDFAQEQKLLKDACKMYNVMRDKPIRQKLSSAEFNKMKALKTRLKQHQMLGEIKLSK